MRWFALLLVGCGFQPGAPAAGGDGAAQADARQLDARSRGSDGAALLPDAPADADPWPCHPKPDAPPPQVSNQPSGADLEMTNIDLSGSGHMIVAAAGATLQLSLSYALDDTRCNGNCRDQIEVGWMQDTTGPRSGCVFDAAVSKQNGVTGQVQGYSITVPTDPGNYDLRTLIGQNGACGTGSGWFAGETPEADWTIARLCVE